MRFVRRTDIVLSTGRATDAVFVVLLALRNGYTGPAAACVGVRYQRSEHRQLVGRPPRPGARRSRHLAAVSRTSPLLAPPPCLFTTLGCRFKAFRNWEKNLKSPRIDVSMSHRCYVTRYTWSWNTILSASQVDAMPNFKCKLVGTYTL